MPIYISVIQKDERGKNIVRVRKGGHHIQDKEMHENREEKVKYKLNT